MSFYEEMRGVADELLGDLRQGSVSLRRIALGTAPNEYTAPTETPSSWPLAATVKRVDQRYEGGTLIVQTGDIVMFAVPPVKPLNSDLLVIDGKERSITNLKAIPAAGEPVYYEAFCAV